ncbi:MAG: transmembrane HD family protein, partial [Sphingobacteriaceae bacterium]
MMAILNSSRQKALMRKFAINIKFLMMFTAVIVIIFTLPKQAKFRYEYGKGRIWNQNDLISPYNFAILKTNIELDANKDAALRSISPVYQFDLQLEKQELDNFKTDFEIKWHNGAFNENQKATYLKLGTDLLQTVYHKGVIALNKQFQHFGENYDITILQNKIAQNKNTAELFTRERALSYCDQILNQHKEIDQSLLIGLLQDHIQYNLNYDAAITRELQKETLESLSQTRGMVQKGEQIVAKGSVINQDVYQKLESYKKAFEDNAHVTGNKYMVLLGQFLLVFLVVSLLIIFLFLFRKDIYNDNRLVGLILLVITSMLVTLSWAIRFQIPSLYYIPYCIVPIIIRILFDTRLALEIHLLVVLIAGFFVPNSFEFAFYELTAGMVSIY